VKSSESLWALLIACLFYVLSDLRKKQRQFFIGISTIFIAVTVVTYLDALIGLAPTVTLIAVQSAVGDFDVQLTKQVHEENIKQFKFDEEMEEYFRGRARQAPAKGEPVQEQISRHILNNEMLPLLNFTWLSEIIDSQRVEGEEALKLFPRWNALSRIINPRQSPDSYLSSKETSTQAVMVAGNSELENEIDVARGFP